MTPLIRPHSAARSARQALAEHRELGRPREADARRNERRRAAVRHEPDVHERQQEVGRRARVDEVGGQRERHADAGARAVDGADDGLRQLAHADEHGVVALVQRALEVGMAVRASARGPCMSRRSAPEQNARPGAGQQHGADARRRRAPPREPRAGRRSGRCPTSSASPAGSARSSPRPRRARG